MHLNWKLRWKLIWIYRQVKINLYSTSHLCTNWYSYWYSKNWSEYHPFEFCMSFFFIVSKLFLRRKKWTLQIEYVIRVLYWCFCVCRLNKHPTCFPLRYNIPSCTSTSIWRTKCNVTWEICQENGITEAKPVRNFIRLGLIYVRFTDTNYSQRECRAHNKWFIFVKECHDRSSTNANIDSIGVRNCNLYNGQI